MLLQLVDDMIYEDQEDLAFVNGLAPCFYDLIKFSSQKLSIFILNIIMKKQERFNKECSCRTSNRTSYPPFSTVIESCSYS